MQLANVELTFVGKALLAQLGTHAPDAFVSVPTAGELRGLSLATPRNLKLLP